jgi:hypothetical protein
MERSTVAVAGAISLLTVATASWWMLSDSAPLNFPRAARAARYTTPTSDSLINIEVEFPALDAPALIAILSTPYPPGFKVGDPIDSLPPEWKSTEPTKTIKSAEVGDTRVTFAAIPSAPRYRVVLWTEDYRHAIGTILPDAAVTPGQPLRSELDPLEAPTGLLLEVPASLAGGTASIRLSQRPAPGSEAASSAFLDFLFLAAQTTAAAYDWAPGLERDAPRPAPGSAIPLQEGLQLLPLLPDPEVGLTVIAASGQALPTQVARLERGMVVPLVLDAALGETLEAGCIALGGTLTYADSDTPADGVTVELLDSVLPPQPVTGGAFSFPCVPRNAPARFRIRCQPPEGAPRPLYPREQIIPYVPVLLTEEQKDATVEWSLPRLKWIRLDLEPARERELRQAAGADGVTPLLETRTDGAWTQVTPLEVLFEGEDTALAVTEPGDYRVGLRVGAKELLYSQPVVLDAVGDAATRLETERGETR